MAAVWLAATVVLVSVAVLVKHRSDQRKAARLAREPLPRNVIELGPRQARRPGFVPSDMPPADLRVVAHMRRYGWDGDRAVREVFRGEGA